MTADVRSTHPLNKSSLNSIGPQFKWNELSILLIADGIHFLVVLCVCFFLSLATTPLSAC